MLIIPPNLSLSHSADDELIDLTWLLSYGDAVSNFKLELSASRFLEQFGCQQPDSRLGSQKTRMKRTRQFLHTQNSKRDSRVWGIYESGSLGEARSTVNR